MKRTVFVVAILFFVYGGCKTIKNAAQGKGNSAKDSTIVWTLQTTEYPVCEELKSHIKKYWYYDKDSKLFNYTYENQHGLTKYWDCFIAMDTTEAFNIMGYPSVMRDGFMFYYTNKNCFTEWQEGCFEYVLNYNGNGQITYIGPQTIRWIK